MFEQTMTIEEHLQDAYNDLMGYAAHLIAHGDDQVAQQFSDRALELESALWYHNHYRRWNDADGIVKTGTRAVHRLEGMAAFLEVAEGYGDK